MNDSKIHWEDIYRNKPSNEVSWYAPHLEMSFEIILGLELPKDAQIIDVGGGASTLPDDLLGADFKNITVLDISSEALKVSKNRLGKKSGLVHWVEGDVTQTSFKPDQYDLWHDRAVFHFLTVPQSRQKYVESMAKSLKPDGYLLMATFGPKGPLKCSGLEIVRYSAESLQKELGEVFQLKKHFTETHRTPFNTSQDFLYCLFRKHKPI